MPLYLPPVPPAIVMPMQGNSVIYVERQSDRSVLVLLGIIAQGDEAEVAKVEAEADKLKIEHIRINPTDGAAAASMFTFPPGGYRSDELMLFHKARDGQLGTVTVKVMVVGKKKVRDVRRLPDDAEVLGPKAIREPRRR
jgi:hypothetical protein